MAPWPQCAEAYRHLARWHAGALAVAVLEEWTYFYAGGAGCDPAGEGASQVGWARSSQTAYSSGYQAIRMYGYLSIIDAVSRYEKASPRRGPTKAVAKMPSFLRLRTKDLQKETLCGKLASLRCWWETYCTHHRATIVHTPAGGRNLARSVSPPTLTEILGEI